MSFVAETESWFERLAVLAFGELRADEALGLQLEAEAQHYIRFNRARIRQASAVTQRRVTLDFRRGERQLQYRLDLAGQFATDAPAIQGSLRQARLLIEQLPPDPFLTELQDHGRSRTEVDGCRTELRTVIQDIQDAAANSDFVGFLAWGPQLRANRNSLGQAHWFANRSLFVDYSIYGADAAGEPRAVKGFFADHDWRSWEYRARVVSSLEQLGWLRRPARSVPPGGYRTFLAPAAVAELLALFGSGALSFGAWKRGDSPLQHLIEGRAVLSPLFNLRENFALGLAPRFNSLGEISPETIPLIESGRLVELLVSLRSAQEYGVAANAAEPVGWRSESPRSPELAPGEIPNGAILAELDTGLYLGNLHYLNWSDLSSARVTGMTRFACFWVERGEIVAPIRDLRFDDSFYRIFGSELVGLTQELETRLDIDTYHQRAVGGCCIPGILLSDFRLTA